jgi:hypothetical protein
MSLPILDEISSAERENILRNFFKEGPDGPLHSYPAQYKKKLVVLAHLANMFELGKPYKEIEVNLKLKPRFEDYVELRRAFIDFGFFERTPDGKEYRRLV